MSSPNYLGASVLALIIEIILVPIWLFVRLSGNRISLKEFHKNAHNKNLSYKASIILGILSCILFAVFVMYAFSKIDRYY